MKKTLFLLTFLFQFIVLFGQTPKWGPWTAVSCYGGFKTSAINNGYVKTINQYSWQVKIKSSYSKKVSFTMAWVVGGETVSIGLITLKPGEEYQHTSRYFKSSANMVYCQVDKVCFNDDPTGCKDGCYALCDNGSPNQPDCDKIGNTSTALNQQAQQQKAAGTYSANAQRVQQDMQRQNQESANKQQQYTEAINAGIRAHNAGDYTGAKSQFTTAIGLSNTSQERSAAQEYYNKSAGSEKSQGTIKAVGDFSQVLIKGLGDIAADAKLRREEKKAQAETDALEAEKKREAAVNTLSDPRVFETYCDFAVANMEALGFKFSKVYGYNISNKSKQISIDFEDNVTVKIIQSYGDAKMYNYMNFETSKPVNKNILEQSSLFSFLKELNYWESVGNFQSVESTNKHYYMFTLFRLEQSQPFINIYTNGYKSENYKGAKDCIQGLVDETQAKLSNSNGNAKGLIESGNLYRDGKGVEKSNVKALEYYNKALQLGETDAMFSIANLYFSANDYQQAKQWYEKYLATGTDKALKFGKSFLASAETYLGNYDKAIEDYKDQLLTDASAYKKATTAKEKYYATQRLYFDNRNIAQNFVNKDDVKEALKWYEEAAAYNGWGAITLAQIYNSGLAYKTTLPGKIQIKKNKALAKEWGNKACLSANNDLVLFADFTEFKSILQGNAKNVCDSANDFLKD